VKYFLLVAVLLLAVGGGLFFLNPGVVGEDLTVAYKVVRVVDGDTIVVVGEDYSGKVRVIGVDAPEVSGEECYSGEAKARVEGWILGDYVNLVRDVDEFDDYGRLLAYVRFDGGDLGVRLASGGFVRYMTVEPNTVMRDVLMSNVYSAKDDGRGLWDVCF